VLAINPPGRGARLREPAITSMAAMVEGVTGALAPYLDLPFLLFGHSVGALVAFEAARALEAQGHRPLHVLLSGCAGPRPAASSKPLPAGDEGLRFVASAPTPSRAITALAKGGSNTCL